MKRKRPRVHSDSRGRGGFRGPMGDMGGRGYGGRGRGEGRGPGRGMGPREDGAGGRGRGRGRGYGFGGGRGERDMGDRPPRQQEASAGER